MIETKNEAFLLRGANQAQVEPWNMPNDPAPDEVLCQTLAIGICGSDIHYLKDGRCGSFVLGNEPMVLGHETAAKVLAVGSNVKHLKPGDRVACEPTTSCGKCEWCLNDRYNLCPDVTCHATPPFHGTLQKYFVHAAKACFKVPDNVTDNECAMIEPLSVAVHACEQVNITKGVTVLITGAGPIGLLSLLVAKAMGASRTVITDLNKNRLDLALELGADEIILVEKNFTETIMIEKIRERFNKNLPDICMECSGVGSNFRLVLLATKPGGSCILVGMGPAEVNLPIATAAQREVRIFGCFRYKDSFPTAIDLVASGKVKLTKLISHQFDFKDSLKAYQTASSGQGNKIIINNFS